MEIRKEYLQSYLHAIAMDQVKDDYLAQGYQVSVEEDMGRYRADLVARKNGETLVIEIKAGRMTPQRRAELQALADYVKAQGNHAFLVVFATPPKEKVIEIEGLDLLLFEHMANEAPEELTELSTHTRVDEIADVVVDTLHMRNEGVQVKGSGLVAVDLQHGSDTDQEKDQGLQGSDSFPFKFEARLGLSADGRWKIVEVVSLDIDIRSY